MVPAGIIRRNLLSIKTRVSDAAERAKRDPESIQLVAVTKSVGNDEIRTLYDLGVRDFGESRVQQAIQKMESFPDLDIRWHMIGRLQTNKARKVAGNFALLHSLDSVHLAESLERALQSINGTLDALVEVNVSGEPAKAGLVPEDLKTALDTMKEFRHIQIKGLMTMPPLGDNPEVARPHFRRLRELRDELAGAGHDNVRSLSMGMSQDFEMAIEEGADFVRVGTALFIQ